MNNVNNYVNLMRKQGQMRVTANPNSEMSMLKQELIEHYKGNPLKAWALINGIENNNFANVSAEQKLHYDAAVMAVRGYPKIDQVPPKIAVTTLITQKEELKQLEQSGWTPLNKAAQLLNEKI